MHPIAKSTILEHRLLGVCYLLLVLGQFHVDVACVFFDAVCTADEAVEMVPDQMLELACLGPQQKQDRRYET